MPDEALCEQLDGDLDLLRIQLARPSETHSRDQDSAVIFLFVVISLTLAPEAGQFPV
jgi:hypothetical protein